MEKAKNENDPRAGPGPQLITSGVQTSGIKSDNNRGVKRAAIAEWRRRWDVDRPALSGCSSQQPNMQSAGLIQLHTRYVSSMYFVNYAALIIVCASPYLVSPARMTWTEASPFGGKSLLSATLIRV